MTRWQLLELGMPATTIDAWLRDGKLIAVHAGVYAVGYRRVEPVARSMAAVLACGPTAVLSHDSAAALWTLRRWPPTPEVTVIGDRRPRRIRVHRSTTLTGADVTVELGVPTTTVARTLRDIRPRLSTRQFGRLVNQARLAHRLSVEDADALLRGRGGAAPTPSRSAIEDAFDAWIVAQDLPRPLRNVRTAAGYEVDALFAVQRVIAEIDHFATHGDRATFGGDRERDAAHAALGYLTVRITPDRLTRAEAERLRRILHARDAT